MGKSKCTMKVAALLMALVIIFIPFGSVFAAGRAYVRNLAVDDGFERLTGVPIEKRYVDHMGTYYVRQGDRYAFLEGEIVNIGSSFDLTVSIRDNDSGRTIRKVTERINVPYGQSTMNLYEFCNVGTSMGGRSIYCSQELTNALTLRTLPVGNYSCSFYVNNSNSGTVVYVKVYSQAAEALVQNAIDTFKLGTSVQSYGPEMYKMTKQQMRGTDFLWNLYVENQAKGIFKNQSSKTILRAVCKVAYGRYPTAAEERALTTYCSVMGVPLTIKRIIYSGKCQNYLMDLDIKP